ncbi:MAG: FecCD family ABC transporter permease [Gammaproteobacteria bacterium]
MTPDRQSARQTRVLPVITGLFFVALIVFLVALATGSVGLSPADVWQGLWNADSGLSRTLVFDLRLPRALNAFATGGLLAIAGVLMQVLLRNPLADPYILGVSGGAAVVALLAIMSGLSGIWINAGAFAGALTATLLVFALAQGRGSWTPLRLLLTGVVLAAGFGAVISLLLAMGPDTSLRGMLFWLMGDLSYADNAVGHLVVLTLAIAAGMLVARQLNVLARGDLQAETLGVAVRPLRIGVYLSSSLITAVAVTTAGSIGFVGLVVPHIVRMITGPDHRYLIPAAALAGGILLTIADTLARTVIAPRQLPVGAITALIGVPLFLILVTRQRAVN